MGSILIVIIGTIILLVVILIIVLYNIYVKDTTSKVIHEKCISNCGDSELTCDIGVCKRVKGASCSMNEDCGEGLYCNNWVCNRFPGPSHPLPKSNKSNKKVKWWK